MEQGTDQVSNREIGRAIDRSTHREMACVLDRKLNSTVEGGMA